MGTDIYFYVEKRENGQWIFVKDIKLDYLNRRNYPFFAILANVRNPVYYEEGPHYYEPISSPKGIPEDASSEYLDILQSERFRIMIGLEAHDGRLLEDFFEIDLPKLLEHGNPENVRILFHFG